MLGRRHHSSWRSLHPPPIGLNNILFNKTRWGFSTATSQSRGSLCLWLLWLFWEFPASVMAPSCRSQPPTGLLSSNNSTIGLTSLSTYLWEIQRVPPSPIHHWHPGGLMAVERGGLHPHQTGGPGLTSPCFGLHQLQIGSAIGATSVLVGIQCLSGGGVRCSSVRFGTVGVGFSQRKRIGICWRGPFLSSSYGFWDSIL